MLLDAVAVRLTPRSGELGDSRSPPGVGVLLGLTFHSRLRPGMTTAGEAMEGSLTQPVFQRLLTVRDRDEHARKFSITLPVDDAAWRRAQRRVTDSHRGRVFTRFQCVVIKTAPVPFDVAPRGFLCATSALASLQPPL